MNPLVIENTDDTVYHSCVVSLCELWKFSHIYAEIGAEAIDQISRIFFNCSKLRWYMLWHETHVAKLKRKRCHFRRNFRHRLHRNDHIDWQNYNQIDISVSVDVNTKRCVTRYHALLDFIGNRDDNEIYYSCIWYFGLYNMCTVHAFYSI